MSNHKFFKWYLETIKTEESLLSQSVTSKILGTSRQAVSKKVKCGTFTEFKHDEFTFVSLKEIKEYILKNM